MKRYLILFFLFLALLFVGVGGTGTVLLKNALNIQGTERLKEYTAEIQSSLQRIYSAAADYPDIAAEVEEASSDLDRLRSEIAHMSIKKDFFRGIAFFITIILVVIAAAGFLFWFVMSRWFVVPLEKIVAKLNTIGKGDFSVSLMPTGAPEIRYLYSQVDKMGTEVEKSQQRIREMERQNIGRFFVHQIRNSVTPIRLSAGILEDGTSVPPEKRKQSTDMIMRETDRINTLLTRFRYLYTFPEPVFARLELNTLLKNVISLYHSVGYYPSSDKIYIRGDQNLLEEAIGNIIDNAIEAVKSADEGGDGDTVSVKIVFPAAVEIRDSGPGIAADVKERVFEEFVSTKPQGMGIGLSFVKRVMDMHGFPVRVESEEGRGTLFRIEMYGKD